MWDHSKPANRVLFKDVWRKSDIFPGDAFVVRCFINVKQLIKDLQNEDVLSSIGLQPDTRYFVIGVQNTKLDDDAGDESLNNVITKVNVIATSKQYVKFLDIVIL